jgi:HTH-type transcriptional regulator, sugar sensing transcriptional regulator
MAMEHDNSKLISLLQSIDVSGNEARTYAALLSFGTASIRKVATETGINRGTTYDCLKHLVALGLVSVKNDGGKRDHYSAESPERINDLIRDKRRDLLAAANDAKDLIPHLLAAQAAPAGRPLVRYYEDDEGVATILRDVLQTCRDLQQPKYYAYSSAPVRQFLYRNFPQFTERRIDEGITVKVISVGEGGEEAEKSERKWLPSAPSQGISSYTIIYGNKIATISIAEDNTPYGVVIEDAGAAAMQRLLFKRLWSQL